MTASVLKQDQNRRKVEKNAYFSQTVQSRRKLSGETFFSGNEQTNNTHVSDERNENRSAYLSVGEEEKFAEDNV